MKLITRDTDYAVRALRFIANQKESVVSAAQLTKRLRIPRPFLRKILQTLNNHGMLSSFKGQGGGFKIVCAPSKISLLNLMQIFQGEIKINECFFKGAICPDRKTCPLKRKIDAIERYVKSQLGKITIASLTNKRKVKRYA